MTRDDLLEVIRLLKCVRVLDCGAHYCRYCPARSPEWEHGPYCPYELSQKDYSDARALADRLSALQAEPPPAPPEAMPVIEQGDVLRDKIMVWQIDNVNEMEFWRLHADHVEAIYRTPLWRRGSR